MFIQDVVGEQVFANIESDIIKELEFNNWNFTSYGVSKMIDTWAERKEKLFEVVNKHPKFIKDKLMIQFDCTTERKTDNYAITNFYDSLCRMFNVKYSGISHWWTTFYSTIKVMTNPYLTSGNAEFFNSYFKCTYFRKGQKTSRAVNKIYELLCEEKGKREDVWFNKAFASFSDAINPKEITRHMCLSIHPMDYLLMSNGNSWSSCHSICTDGGEEPGGYCSGAVSYMLDETSMILYEVEEFDESPQTLPKIIRQVICFDGEHLVLNRLYPQNFDNGADSIYSQLSEIIRELLNECFETKVTWIREDDSDKQSKVFDNGTAYPDWLHVKHTQFWKTADVDWKGIAIGETPICVECGRTHTYASSITCCSTPPNSSEWICDCCGASYFSEDELYYSDYEDEYLCEDCRVWCEILNDYIRESTRIYTDSAGNFVPQHLIDDETYFVCEHCGEIHYYAYENGTDDGYKLCPSCYEDADVVTKCEECGLVLLKAPTFETEIGTLCDECHDAYLEQMQTQQSA